MYERGVSRLCIVWRRLAGKTLKKSARLGLAKGNYLNLQDFVFVYMVALEFMAIGARPRWHQGGVGRATCTLRCWSSTLRLRLRLPFAFGFCFYYYYCLELSFSNLSTCFNN